MTSLPGKPVNVTIACGGTGGHVFPGLAVAEQLIRRGAAVTLMVSTKEIDQVAVKGAKAIEIVTLPAVGLSSRRALAFLRGFLASYRTASTFFRRKQPQAVLAMGGFTSAPPVLAARRFKAASFLHESNSIPGRANRWLSWIVHRAFIGFPSAAQRLHTRRISLTGTPVRSQFQQLDCAGCRLEMGLDPVRPVALVMGGSQGAHGINELISKSLPLFAQQAPDWQWIHLAGAADADTLKQRYVSLNLFAVVHSYFARMDLAMGAAAACISRAGASSLAEIAALRLPAVLIPFPAATDDHQFHNARAFEQTGAVRLLEQQSARPEDLFKSFGELMWQDSARRQMQVALADWHKPQAADQIAQVILESFGKNILPKQASASARQESSSDDLGRGHSSSLQWTLLNSSVPGKGRKALKARGAA